jgi:hypothetical protein
MTVEIRIIAGNVTMNALFNGSDTAKKIWEALPIEAGCNTWGEEIYFRIPVKMKEDKARDVVESGELGYWPAGSAFCIFFGKTPASRGDEIRAASPVNIIGKLKGDPKEFKKVVDGERIRLEKSLTA